MLNFTVRNIRQTELGCANRNRGRTLASDPCVEVLDIETSASMCVFGAHVRPGD